MCHPPTCSTTTALLLREDSKDGKYIINNYIPTIILQVYFSNDVARLQRSDVSESDDC